MKNNQTSIKSEVVAALKEMGVVTKDDLKEGLGKLERSLKRHMGHHRNKILETIGKLATNTPTITAFRELETRVDKAISN